MDLIREFFRGKSAAHLLMLAAILLLFFSQFFYYLDDPSNAFLSLGPDFSSSTLYIFDFGAKGTGWELHPHAWVILVVLAFAFLREDIYEHRLFVRFGWWAAVVLVIAATAPGAYFRAFGGGLGGVSVLMALIAATLHAFRPKRTPQP
jgi:hypothetical protein